MELDLAFYAVVIPVVLYAGIDKAGFGSAASVAAAAGLALILEPAQAVAIMLPLLILMDFVALPPNWRRWDPSASRLLIVGTSLGAVIGAGLIFFISADVFRGLIGATALVFVGIQFARRRGWLVQSQGVNRSAGLGLGTLAGVTSFVAHSGGAVASIYLLSKDLTKTAYQATTIITFWVNNLLKFALYVGLGLLSWETAFASLTLAPFAIIGTRLGVHLNRIVPERVYFALIYVFLTITGTKLIYDVLA